MTPQRYQQINTLADAALEIPPAQRQAFLDEACGADADLRGRVEELLAAHTSEHVFLDAPALELLAKDMAAAPRGADLTGKQIEQYKVVSRLGAGGVGEVWLARDKRLMRDVALKILSPRFADDASHVRRLEREARAASSLNHPNIVTIYEVGEFEGVNFIAQEFVGGETLRQKLLDGALPVQAVLDIGGQVAGALAAAHSAGIVHRDIKPENVMIRPDGLVKVLDFGLARFVEGEAEGAMSRSHSITRPGMVIGTVRYMSPEQARGLTVDARSDIFTLGVVLYELLAGTPPFSGPTPTDTVAAILGQEPEPLTRYLPDAPAELERIVRRCLNKEPASRYASARELQTDLRRLARRLEFPDQPTPSDERPAMTPRRKTSRASILSTIALAAAFLAVAFYTMSGRRQQAPAFSAMKISRVTTPGEVSDAAISPDGRYVAYFMDESRGQSLWMTQLATSTDRTMLPAEPGQHSGLTFSADGNYIYYRRRGGADIGALYRLPVLGGAAARLMDDVSNAIAFAPDGRQFAYIHVDPARRETNLMIANADGSGQRVLATRRRPYYFSRYGMAWSPDGRFIACFGGHAAAYTTEAFHLLEVRVADGVERTITSRAWKWAGTMAWSAGGRKLFFSGTEQLDDAYQIWMVTLPGGEVSRLTNDLNNYSRISITSDAKTILALETQKYADIWVARANNFSHAAQATFGGIHGLNSLAWTPDGKIVYSALAGDYHNIWIMDADGKDLKQLTSGEGNKDELAVTRDGRYILYQSQGNIWRVNIDGSNPVQLTHGAMDVHPNSSADSATVVFASFIDWSPGMAGKPTLWKVPIDGGKPMPLSQDPASIPQVSPDGRLIACEYFPGAEPQLSRHLIAMMDEGGTLTHVFQELPVSFSDLRWAPDGKAVTYAVNTGEAGNVWRQGTAGGAGNPITEFRADEIFTYGWSRDGRLALARGKRVNGVDLISGLED